jgi:uncharacterized protein
VALSLRVLRGADRLAVAWKNGGGLTREVAKHPPGSGLDSFEWRVSTAEVRSSGPFSAFPGIDRVLAVLEGSLKLVIAGRAPMLLSPHTPPVHFPGDVAVSAEPTGGPVIDLNVMIRRDRYQASMSRILAPSSTLLSLPAACSVLIALAPLVVRSGAGAHELARLDAALVEGAAECELQCAELPCALWLVEITRRTGAPV